MTCGKAGLAPCRFRLDEVARPAELPGMAPKARYGFTIVTCAVFLVTLAAHWGLAWSG